MNGFESQEKEMEYEILFCHHCDDSLAGHRSVLKARVRLDYVKILKMWTVLNVRRLYKNHIHIRSWIFGG